jgi:cation diffusion facilitator family transporter
VIKLLMKCFLPADADPKDPRTRQRAGALSGGTGIVLNLLLFLGKLCAGLITGSIAMVADAVNNLSDAASSVVTLVGFRMAGQKADRDHPFGHGRLEYLTGLIVSLAILLMGLEVGRSAVEKLFQSQETGFSWLAAGILLASIGVKLWMFAFNRTLGRAIDSKAMEATAADALSDTVSTGVVLLSTLAGHFWGLHIDALAGLLVAVFIFKTGLDSVKETMDPLLGRPMDPKLAEEIDALVLEHPYILGVHDLVYHDYGPGRAMMSFHAEVPADSDFLAAHDMIDHIERELKQKYQIETVIHMDPVVNDQRTLALRGQVKALAQSLDPDLTIHDFRMTAGPHHTNLIFDLVVPFGFRLSDEQVKGEMDRRVRELSPNYYTVIQVDHSFVDRREE